MTIAEAIRWAIFGGIVIVAVVFVVALIIDVFYEVRDWRRARAPRRRTVSIITPDGRRHRA